MTRLASNLHNTLLLCPAEQATELIDQASAFAQAFGARLSVLLLTIVPDPTRYPQASGDVLRQAGQAAEAASAAALVSLKDSAGEAITASAFVGDFRRLVDACAAAAINADLVIVPGPDRWPSSALLDAVMNACMDNAASPIMVLRDRPLVAAAARVLIAWDGSRPCARAWRDARLLMAPDAHVHIAFGGRVDRPEATAFAAGLAPAFVTELHEVAIHAVPFERRTATQLLVELEQTLHPDFTIIGGGTGSTFKGMLANGLIPLLTSR